MSGASWGADVRRVAWRSNERAGKRTGVRADERAGGQAGGGRAGGIGCVVPIVPAADAAPHRLPPRRPQSPSGKSFSGSGRLSSGRSNSHSDDRCASRLQSQFVVNVKSICVCARAYVRHCLYMHAGACAHVCVYLCVYACMCICVCMCVYACACVSVYVYVHVFACVCVCVCMCVLVFVYGVVVVMVCILGDSV